jgi:hypothetical protein
MKRIALLLVASLLALLVTSPASAESNSSKSAVLVGIDKYQGRVRPNPGSVGDVQDMKRFLISKGWHEDRILVLTDSKANAANIRNAMRWLVDMSSASSWSVFFYSGHVKQMGGDRDRDGEAVDEFLWPQDNNFISDGELSHYMRQLRGSAWIDISGCEAAGFDDNLSSPKRLFTASSQESEKSYQHHEWKNSVWTHLFVEKGMIEGGADVNSDGYITLREAFNYGAERAPAITQDQRKGPQHPIARGGSEVFWFEPPPEQTHCQIWPVC